METSRFREAASRSATQELLNIARNLVVHFRIHNSPPLVLILRPTNKPHRAKIFL
jgi:hypothetical protein